MSTAADLAAQVRSGDERSASRLISLIERGDPVATEAVAVLFPSTGAARAIGITGPPGAGKSTLVKGLIDAYHAAGVRVGVLAVDPSSQATGGALLGDRLRMMSATAREGLFIRSMAVREQPGGIALATAQAMRVLDAMGCDRLLVETVGVGQSEIAIARAVDCTLLVLHPGAGDEVQALKSGVMEIGDVYAVNKADQAGADSLSRQLKTAARMLPPKDPPREVLMVSARTGDGIAALVGALEARLEHLSTTGELQRQRLRNLQHEAFELVVKKSVENALASLGHDPIAAYASDLDQRKLDPSTVASLVLAQQPSNGTADSAEGTDSGTSGAM